MSVGAVLTKARRFDSRMSKLTSAQCMRFHEKHGPLWQVVRDLSVEFLHFTVSNLNINHHHSKSSNIRKTLLLQQNQYNSVFAPNNLSPEA
jgi:hypothetical protein